MLGKAATCACGCGQAFIKKRHGQRFASTACRIRYHRRQNAERMPHSPLARQIRRKERELARLKDELNRAGPMAGRLVPRE